MILKYPIFLLLIIPIIAIFYFFRVEKTTHAIQFPKTALLGPLSSKKATRLLFLTQVLEFIIIFLIILSLTQPQFIRAKKFNTKKGIDIITILDTSRSMNAEDFKPKNRMSVAKETLNNFIKKRKNDRLGLIIFGSDALTKSPLTFDHGILKYQINEAQVGQAGDGTAIGLAIATGLNRLENSKASSKIMILITDGVNNSGQIDPISAAKFAQKRGIKIYTIGIGSTEGAPIPIYHPTYGKRYQRYPNGQLVLTEFDDTSLQEISKITNAQYFNATNTDELKLVYKEIDQLEKTEIKTMNNIVAFDFYPYLIGLILILFFIREMFLTTSLIGVRS